MWIIPKTLSAFAPDMVELKWELSELASLLEQSAMWRSKPSLKRTWLQRLNKVKWMQHLSGRILRPSMDARFVEKYTESLAVIPASHFQTPDSEKEPKTQDTFSRIYANTFKQLDLFGASLKMSADTSIWDSTKFTKAFEIWVIKLRQDCLQRQRSARHIRENDCSSWRSPAVSEPGVSVDRLEGEIGARFYDKVTGRLAQVGLQQQVNWQTPKVATGDYSYPNGDKNKPFLNLAGQVKVNWPTPRVFMYKDAQEDRGKSNLGEVVHNPDNWPSPTVAEAQKIGNNANYGQIALSNHPAIRGVVSRDKKAKGDGQPDQDKSNTTGKNRGQLNPAWVEQLMGLPAGWTNFDCLETA